MGYISGKFWPSVTKTNVLGLQKFPLLSAGFFQFSDTQTVKAWNIETANNEGQLYCYFLIIFELTWMENKRKLHCQLGKAQIYIKQIESAIDIYEMMICCICPAI